jgi:hypothetical protein
VDRVDAEVEQRAAALLVEPGGVGGEVVEASGAAVRADTLPSAPLRTQFAARRTSGCNSKTGAQASLAPFSRAAAMIAVASSTEVAIGFSE